MQDADAVQLLVDMVRIPSVSYQEGPLAEFLVERMAAAGYTRCFVDAAGNAVGLIGTGARQVVLLGHLDTVPGAVAVRREGDLLYGRGTVDAKGPLAAFVTAAARAGPRDGCTIVVVGAVEEEAATSQGARYVAGMYHPSACIIGEPSGWSAITTGYKGRLLVDYRLSQRMSHTAGPGISASERGVGFWNAVVSRVRGINGRRLPAAELDLQPAPRFTTLDPSLRSIRSGSDGLEETVELTVAFRIPTGFDTGAWKRELESLAGDAELSCYGDEAAFVADKNTALVRALLFAIRSHAGRPSFKLKTGTSDMNVIGPIWGCPIVAYGPGDSALDHTPDERVSIAEYLRAITVLETFLRDDRLFTSA